MKTPKTLSAMLAKTKMLVSKHSPEIWIGAGVITVLGGTILACRASMKLEAVMEGHEVEREMLDADFEDAKLYTDSTSEEGIEKRQVQEGEEVTIMTEKQYKKECALITLSTAGELAQMYAPSVLMISGGIAMIVGGHRILQKRHAVLLAAYTALDDAFTKYRQRVADRYGSDVEDDIYTGRTYIEEKHTEVDENGKKKKVVEKIPVPGDSISPYAVYFSPETTKEWTNSPSYNHTFLVCQQNSANNMLQRNGFLFLKDVYDMLGIDPTPTSVVCGWILPEQDGEESEGDDYIDFGITEVRGDDPENREGAILLDFNCQGMIYDKI